jgi:hypothetical protein
VRIGGAFWDNIPPACTRQLEPILRPASALYCRNRDVISCMGFSVCGFLFANSALTHNDFYRFKHPGQRTIQVLPAQ